MRYILLVMMAYTPVRVNPGVDQVFGKIRDSAIECYQSKGTFVTDGRRTACVFHYPFST